MEIFHKGFDPPIIFGSYGTREAQFNFWSQKRGKTKLLTNTQNGYF